MLYLLGTGLYYLSDIPLRAVDILKKCSRVFLERYTNINDIGFIAELERITDKKIEIIGRELLEGEYLISLARDLDVALLVPGDPLFATTHISLVVGCKKNGIKYKIVHASSISTAVAETGLSPYKFGAVCSIPLYSKGFKPESFFDVVEKNLKEGFHSLVLLEAKNDAEFVSVEDAISILKGIADKRKTHGIDWKNVICMSSMGSDEQNIFFVSSGSSAYKPPLALVIPASMSTIENENVHLLLDKN
ncbi:MAG: diphthine synthase [Candidatus Parvarchaeota archaeon]|nr:diphthine synthase [Candidatus Parvarchaeota archaeon]